MKESLKFYIDGNERQISPSNCHYWFTIRPKNTVSPIKIFAEMNS